MNNERKVTLKEATDNIVETLHCCDVEAQEFSNWIASNGTPDAVIILEFVENIVLAASKYADDYNKYIEDKVNEALADSRPMVSHEDAIARIGAIIETTSTGDA